MRAKQSILMCFALLLAGGCWSTAPSEPSRAPSAAETASMAAALDAIVVTEALAPKGTKFLQSFDGSFSATQVVQDSPSEVQSAVLEGWVDALTREFASPETADVIRGNAPPGQLDPADHHFVGSIASAYEDAESAQRALEAILEDTRPRMRTEESLDLGDGGTAFHDRFLHVPSITYVWSNDRFLLVLGGNGMDESVVRALAQGMNERVP
jgi:hypothetical protein